MEASEPFEGRSRVVIVGAGRVGSAAAYAAMITGLAGEIVLVDQDLARAEGEAMDLSHGLPYTPPAAVRAGGFEDCAGADVVILTAGAARQPGDSRLDLARRNLDLIGGIVPRIMPLHDRAVVVVVSNPVDLVTRAVWRLSGLPAGRIIGTGTTLDTARLRILLAAHFDVSVRNVHAYVVGEHGETEVPTWSQARIANVALPEFAKAAGKEWSPDIRAAITEKVRTAGAEVIRRKGATQYAIGLATVRLARSILQDERSVLTVSTVFQGEQNLRNVALSFPCLIGRAGRRTTLPLALDPGEEAALFQSAETLQQAYREAGGP